MPPAKISDEDFERYVLEGKNARQIADIIGMRDDAVRVKAARMGLTLTKVRYTKKFPKPPPPLRPVAEVEDISPALIRLAQFDSIAAAALRRKRGEAEPEPHLPEES